MPFCPECGYEMRPDAKFCLRCGYRLTAAETAAAARPVNASGTGPSAGDTQVDSVAAGKEYLEKSSALFRDYFEKVTGRFSTEAEFSILLGAFCLKNAHANLSSILNLGKNHYHYFIRYDQNAVGKDLIDFSKNCLEDVWSMPHHGALGLNTFAVPLLCQDTVSPDLLSSLTPGLLKKTSFSFSAVSYPVILELSTGKLSYPSTPLYGAAVYTSLKKAVGDTLYYRR